MNRRTFVASASVAAATVPNQVQAAPAIPIIDTHIHLFDTNRPGGVPWPPKDNKALYKPALPSRYRALAAPLGIVGAIEVEASPLLEDNQWILDTMATDKIMVGTVGDLDAGKPGFAKNLERFKKNKMFLGIRCGGLWGRDMVSDVANNPQFITDLKLLAQAGLELDTANQTPTLIKTTLKVTDLVPNLRIVVDHLPQMNPPTEPAALKAYMADLRELAKRPQVYFKVSEVLRKVDGKLQTDPKFYKERLDLFWETFGPDKLLYGSDWPNSDNWAPYPQVFAIVRDYFMAKGQAAAEKFFWKNSIAAYKWVHRDPSQPKLG